MSVSTEILVCTSVRLTAWLEGVRAPLNSSCLVMDSRPLEAGATRTLKLSTQDHWVCQSLRETVTLCPLTPEIYLYQPPRLCKSLPQTMRVKEWQMLFFECKVEGFPKPTVTWLCNGEELTNKGHVKIIAVKNYHSCEIARAYAERDTGKFTVRLSHPSGSVIESSCEVEIQQDITLLSDLKEKKKSDLVLEREAKAEQLAAKYAKKAEEVTKSSKTETTESVTTVESEKVSAVEKTAEGTAAKVVEEAVAEAAAVVSKETVKEPAPSAETASAPVEAAPEPAPEPAPAAEPVPEPAPKSEAAPAPAAEPAPKPAPEPAPEPEAAPAPAAEPAPEPAPEPEAAPAPAAEPAPEPVPEPVPEPAPEPAAPEPAPVSEPVAEEATKADAAPEVAKEDEVDAAPQPEPCESSVPEEKEPAYVSPDFVTKLEKEYRCLDTDTNIKIQCQVEGKPLPEVSWVKDNKKLSPSENLTVEWNADSGISTLWFQSLTVQDSGKYTCIASSSAGSCSCSATFTVDTAAANLSLAGVKPERAPTVKKGLDKEYSFVTTDTKAKLQCEVDGHPTPDVLWKKDGKTLVNGSKHGIEWDAASGKATLKFKSLTEADSGCYECSASSTAGSVSSSANITVKKPEKKPTVVDALKKEYSFVETKETVRLQCKMEGNPCPEISWTKDGKALGASEQMTFEWNAKTGVAALVFKGVSVSNTGKYECVAKSSVGTTKSATTMTVKEPERAPSVVEPLNKEYNALESDENVCLKCKLDGNPVPKISWTKDGKKLSASDNVKMEWDAATCTASLVFKHPKSSDSGNYECVAKSSAGTTKSPTTLTIKKPDVIPTIQRPLEKTYTTVEGGESLRLKCQVDGYPSPHVTWKKDEKEVVLGDNVAMEWNPETGSAALVFKQPMCEDSGDYQCVATSPVGTTNSHTTLTVKKPEKVPSVVEQLDKVYDCQEGGDSVRLTCQVEGNPSPTVTWLKDGKEVTADGNIIMEWDPETGSAALVFKRPTCEDSGDYQCVAKSPLGTTNSHTTLTVKKVPTVVKPLNKAYEPVERDQNVRLVCKLDGTPAPEITWLKDGKKIVPGENVAMEWDPETGSAALVFKQPTCEDSGDYQCVAKSPLGTTNSHTTLSVKKVPTVVKPLDKAYEPVEGDQNVRLVCKLDGTPAPEITWLKDGKKVVPGENVAMEWDPETGSAALVFKQPMCEDSGDYQCVAKSPLGTTNSHTTLTVKKPEKKPAVVQPLDKEYNLTETKETITLTFKVDGNPVPEVSWLKDGKPLEAGGNISFGWNAETGSASLIFNGVSVGDSGKYECVATSTIGKTTSSTTIAVKKPEKKPTFSTPLQKENNKKEGDENFVMTCTVEGNPPPQVSWMKNGAKLEADDNISAQYDAEKGTASLTFKVLSCADAGNYECVAVSSAGTGKSKASLTVKSKKCFSPTTNQAFITSHQVPEIKPKFSKELDETYKVLVGDKNVTLACVVDGNPCPDVSWYKDGKKEKLVDTTNMKMKFDQSTGNASLIFSSVSLSDAGSYVCLADSAIGNKRSETSLKVTKPVCPPVFTDMATSQTVPVGGVAVFKCIVTSKSPATFTWKKGDKVLSSTDRIKISVSKTDTSLTITGVQFDDRATYTCSAKNEDGEEHTSGDLNVEEKGVKGRRTPLSDGPSSFIAGDEDDVFLPDDRKPKASYTWDTYVQDITILAEGHALYIADNINSDEESVVQHEHSNTNNVETANEEEYIVTLKISPDHYDSEMSHAVTNTEYGAESLEDGTTESNNSVDPTLSVQEENLPLSNHKRTQSEEMENDFESNTNLNGVVNKMELKELIQDCKTLKTEEGEEKDCTSSGHPESPVKPINFSFLINASPEDDSGEDSYSYEYSSESGEDFTQTLTGTRDRGYIDNIGSFERATLKDVEQVLPDNRDTRPGNRNIGLDDRDVGPDNRDTRPDNRDIELDDRIPIRNSEMLEEILEETVGGDLEEEAGQDVVDGAVESKVAVATESKSETVKVAETKSETTATQEVSVTKEEVKVVKAKSESVSKQEVSVKKEEAKVTQVTSESVSAAGEQSMERLSKGAENNVKDINKSTVQVLQELESSVSKLNETLSQTQETSVASSTSDSRIEIVEVTARHITNETSDEASEVRHRHHDHHGPEIIVPANSTKIPEHSEVELMVKVRAAKQANVRWMHEGEVVQQSERGYAMFVMLYILAYYIMLTRT
ncbi:hemicentin-1-like isoform X26 [Pecten maximus]|uniref:hemicentin-1-like isoform X26 n=1 Tax=Pecten maximus TaxID=6579 RepID=UPI001458F5C7|nr:hemicentin-1-like isoform X26 [Pecten maximus]